MRHRRRYRSPGVREARCLLAFGFSRKTRMLGEAALARCSALSLPILVAIACMSSSDAVARAQDQAGTVLITKEPIDVLPREFHYSRKTLERLQDEARSGSPQAAHKVMQYYYRYADGMAEKIRWARVAAQGGDLQGMEMLAVLLRENGDCRNAVGWLERAIASSGDTAFAGGAASFKKEILADRSCGW
jgi:hypothetical protein